MMSRLVHPLALVLALAAGALAACFAAPSDPVLFACEFDGDDRCPPDYECRADNCCHREDTAADANVGECALGGPPAATETGATQTETTTDTDTDTDMGSETDTGSETTG